MSDEYTVFDNIRIIAQNELSLIQDEINILQIKMNEYRGEQKRLKAVIKATHENTNENPKPRKTAPAGIRDETRKKIVNAVSIRRNLGHDEFTVEDIKLESNMAESTVARGISVLREEGIIRQVGVQGRAPLYKWVTNA